MIVNSTVVSGAGAYSVSSVFDRITSSPPSLPASHILSAVIIVEYHYELKKCN